MMVPSKGMLGILNSLTEEQKKKRLENAIKRAKSIIEAEPVPIEKLRFKRTTYITRDSPIIRRIFGPR